MCANDRALIGHYGKDKIDLDFLPLATGSSTATTLGTDVRPWLVDLGDIDGAGIGLAVVGGFLGFIVMFFDQNITVRLVNAREHNLKKGSGYDMDMLALSPVLQKMKVGKIPIGTALQSKYGCLGFSF